MSTDNCCCLKNKFQASWRRERDGEREGEEDRERERAHVHLAASVLCCEKCDSKSI